MDSSHGAVSHDTQRGYSIQLTSRLHEKALLHISRIYIYMHAVPVWDIWTTVLSTRPTMKILLSPTTSAVVVSCWIHSRPILSYLTFVLFSTSTPPYFQSQLTPCIPYSLPKIIKCRSLSWATIQNSYGISCITGLCFQGMELTGNLLLWSNSFLIHNEADNSLVCPWLSSNLTSSSPRGPLSAPEINISLWLRERYESITLANKKISCCLLVLDLFLG